MFKKSILFLLTVSLLLTCGLPLLFLTSCPPPEDDPTPEPTPVITPIPAEYLIEKRIRTYNSGSDGIWFNGDDEIIGASIRDNVDPTGFDTATDKQFWGAGSDGIWFTSDDNKSGYWWSRNGILGHWCWGSGSNGIWYDYDDNFDAYALYDDVEQGIYGDFGADSTWFTADDQITAAIKYEYSGGVRTRRINYVDAGTDATWFTSDDVVGVVYEGAYLEYEGNTSPDFPDNWTKGISYNGPGPDDVWFTSDDSRGWYSIREYDGINDEAHGFCNWTKETIYWGPGPDATWDTSDDEIRKYSVVENIFSPVQPTPTPAVPDPPLPDPTLTPTPPPVPTPAAPNTITENFDDGVADNFIDDGSGRWAVATNEYMMSPNSDNTFSLSYYNSIFTDFTLSVDARQTAGAPYYAYGLLFRTRTSTYQEDSYLLMIDSNGYWYFAKQSQWTFLYLQSWTTSLNLIAGLDTVNNIKVTCTGNSISVYLNDVLEGTFLDTNSVMGFVGVMGFDPSSYSNTYVFDNFVIDY